MSKEQCLVCKKELNEKQGSKIIRGRPLPQYGERCQEILLVCTECFKKNGGQNGR